MRDMPQGTFAVSLQFDQAQAQPVQTLAQTAQIDRTTDLNRFIQAARAQATNRQLKLAHRTNQPPTHRHRCKQSAAQRQRNLLTEIPPVGIEILEHLLVPAFDPALARPP